MKLQNLPLKVKEFYLKLKDFFLNSRIRHPFVGVDQKPVKNNAWINIMLIGCLPLHASEPCHWDLSKKIHHIQRASFYCSHWFLVHLVSLCNCHQIFCLDVPPRHQLIWYWLFPRELFSKLVALLLQYPSWSNPQLAAQELIKLSTGENTVPERTMRNSVPQAAHPWITTLIFELFVTNPSNSVKGRNSSIALKGPYLCFDSLYVLDLYSMVKA